MKKKKQISIKEITWHISYLFNNPTFITEKVIDIHPSTKIAIDRNIFALLVRNFKRFAVYVKRLVTGRWGLHCAGHRREGVFVRRARALRTIDTSETSYVQKRKRDEINADCTVK